MFVPGTLGVFPLYDQFVCGTLNVGIPTAQRLKSLEMQKEIPFRFCSIKGLQLQGEGRWALGKDMYTQHMPLLVPLHGELSPLVAGVLNSKESGRKTILSLPKRIHIPTQTTSSSFYSRGYKAGKIHILYLTPSLPQTLKLLFPSLKTKYVRHIQMWLAS